MGRKNRHKLRGDQFSNLEELKKGIPQLIPGVKEYPAQEILTPDEIQNRITERMREQDQKFLSLSAENMLTPQWRRYAKRRELL